MPTPIALARAVARRRPDELVAHAELTALFGEPPADEVKRLARALARGHDAGPLPEVTPDGRVIAGYAAVLAARQAGLDELDVAVREDLAGRGDALVALAVIDTALGRGDLPPLDVARCLKRARELRGKIDYEYVKDYQRGDLCEQVALRLGLSMRSAQRYLRLLEAPAEVQSAFTRGEIPLTLAERAADLSPPKQSELAKAIHASNEPRKVLAAFVKLPSGRHCRAHGALRALLKSLRRGLDDLDGRIGDVKSLSAQDAGLIDDAIEQLQSLRATATVVTPEQQAANLEALRQAVMPREP